MNKTKETELEYFDAISIKNINSANKEEIAEVLIAAANWIKAVGNERISLTFELGFCNSKGRT